MRFLRMRGTGVLGEYFFDKLIEHGRLEWFHDISPRPEFQRLQCVFLLALGADDDYRYLAVNVFFFEFLHKLDTIHYGHSYIKEDEIEIVLPRKDIEGLESVHGIHDTAPAIPVEHKSIHGMNQLGIIHDKYFV